MNSFIAILRRAKKYDDLGAFGQDKKFQSTLRPTVISAAASTLAALIVGFFVGGPDGAITSFRFLAGIIFALLGLTAYLFINRNSRSKLGGLLCAGTGFCVGYGATMALGWFMHQIFLVLIVGFILRLLFGGVFRAYRKTRGA